MFGYKVKIRTITTQYEREDEQWGSWSEHREHYINPIVEKTKDCPDVVSLHDIPSGSQAIVVWAIWSTGDSFGYCTGAESEAFGIFTDIAAANELAKHLETLKTSYVSFSTSDGQKFEVALNPWYGYFERLDSVEISVVTVF